MVVIRVNPHHHHRTHLAISKPFSMSVFSNTFEKKLLRRNFPFLFHKKLANTFEKRSKREFSASMKKVWMCACVWNYRKGWENKFFMLRQLHTHKRTFYSFLEGRKKSSSDKNENFYSQRLRKRRSDVKLLMFFLLF